MSGARAQDRARPVPSTTRGSAPPNVIAATNAGAVDDRAVSELLRAQDGVVSRRQLLALEVTDSEIERKLRRREWARVHGGVYVEHTGPLTWPQRAWAAVLFYAPAALAGSSALRAANIRGHHQADDAPLRICVEAGRTVRSRPDIFVERLAHWESWTQTHLSPPRQRLEHALVYTASAKVREDEAVALLADAVQQGRTTPGRLVAALEEHSRLRHRRLLLEILRDVDAGAYSVLERHYLVRVERPHGLPTAERQRRVKQGRSPAFRDVDYIELGTSVELDGRIGHEEAADRWADLDRDLAAVVAGDLTLRAGWGQVLEPCRLAEVLGRILLERGPVPTLRGCCEGCPVNAAISPAPGAGEIAAS
jgi:hypothetical protein